MSRIRFQQIYDAFTLAELLIALAILAVIATFTIPKVLTANQNSRFNAVAKEAAGSASAAYQSFLMQNQATSSTGFKDLTPYLSYVNLDTVTDIDHYSGSTVRACSAAAILCLKLHNGAMLRFDSANIFGSTTAGANFYFQVDPDGKVTDSSTNGPGKAVEFVLHYNGKIETKTNMGTCTNCDPSWFSWN